MEIKLSFSLFFIAISSFAQNSIASFYGKNETSYSLLQSTKELDHGASDANQNWNFSGLTAIGTSIHKNTTPTALEVGNYPGTTVTMSTTFKSGTTSLTSELFAEEVAGELLLNAFSTGLGTNSLLLTFGGPFKPSLGNFPTSYPSIINNQISGDFTFNTTTKGTFRGSFLSETDAYGNLNISDFGKGAYSGKVTRKTTVLEINLYVLVFGTELSAGTIKQTTYNYFDNNLGSGNPIFRQINTNVVVPLQNINQVDITIEKFDKLTLGTENYKLENAITLKNPFDNTIELNNAKEALYNTNISILDMSGKNVYEAKEKTIETGLLEIPSHFLSKGIYLLNIKSDNSNFTKKIIKQ